MDKAPHLTPKSCTNNSLGMAKANSSRFRSSMLSSFANFPPAKTLQDRLMRDMATIINEGLRISLVKYPIKATYNLMKGWLKPMQTSIKPHSKSETLRSPLHNMEIPLL